jgi:exodeoxyribonuclease VII large subunit
MAVKIFSVGQVNRYIKNIISQDYLLRDLTIKGEVSNCKYHSSGHIYFSLKDETGNLNAMMFSGDASGLKFRLQDGQAVLVKGRIDIYERDGKYQLYAKEIRQDGVGSLAEQFEILKMRLNEEGLFDFEHKKEIPKFPKTVGVVTASTGAAVQDIKNVARRRNPYVQLVLYPAKVQGEGAAETIVKGIRVLDSMNVDTIIVGRGGGSIEDLWAFNEEIVVRAIYEAHTPIISGTGHEVDTTLADYAADLRAPTPSAAAELAIPDVMITVNQFHTRERALQSNMNNRLRLTKSRLDTLETKLYGLSPERRFMEQKKRFDDSFNSLNRNMDRRLEQAKHRYSVITARLNALSPTAKLVGGFGYVESGGKPLISAETVKSGDKISITVSDGVVNATVD